MLDLSLSLAFLPKYFRLGFASVESADLDPEYYVVSYTFWIFFIGFTLTLSAGKHV